MLSKLVKYEFKATSRTILWVFLAFAVIAAVSAIFFGNLVTQAEAGGTATDTGGTAKGLAAVLLFFAYFASMAVMMIVVVVVVISRFARTMLGRQAYLTHTLPASREQLLLAKLITGSIWSIASTGLVLLSLFLFSLREGGWGDMVKGLREMAAEGSPIGQSITLLALLIVVSATAGTLMFYAAISWGPNLLKNRVGGSILAFIILYIATQIASFIALLGAFSGTAMDALAAPGADSAMDAAAQEELLADPSQSFAISFSVSDFDSMNYLLGMQTILWVCFGVVFWLLARYMLRRKLNLA
ncbi:MAG: hypothetical protein LBR44_02105 [Clostridiales Family XIII bacterium]|jgi:hypothetical protein|nr:hypothetical protein [Clostridiales Family XIII bacterium]